MPAVKKTQRLFGLHMELLPLVFKHCQRNGFTVAQPSNRKLRRGKPGGAMVPLQREEVMVLIRMAHRPEVVGASDWQAIKALWAKWPDETLSIVAFIRRTLTDWTHKNPSGFIRLFLRTNTTVEIDGKRRPIASLLDKELAGYLETETGFSISADLVKKARQSVAQTDGEARPFRNKQALIFARTGKRPSKPARKR